MQHDAAVALEERSTVRAEDAHVEQLIERWSLTNVLAYAALHLPSLEEVEAAFAHERPTRFAPERATLGAVSQVITVAPRKAAV